MSEGDERVEKYMLPVSEAIQRHLKWPSPEYTDIYNRAYEAVYNAIREYDTAHPDPAWPVHRDSRIDGSK